MKNKKYRGTQGYADPPDMEPDVFREAADDLEGWSSSAWDCTGMIPSLPQSEAQLEAYQDLYRYVQPALREAQEEKESGQIE